MSAAPLFTSFADALRAASGGVEVATLLAPGQSDGRSDVREIRCDAGKAVDAVGDVQQHRYVYVLDGDWTMVVGGDRHTCAAGAALVAPRGMECSAAVTGLEIGRLLVLSFPI